MFSNKFPSIPSTVHLSLPEIPGYVFNSITPPYTVIIEVWLAKFSF